MVEEIERGVTEAGSGAEAPYQEAVALGAAQARPYKYSVNPYAPNHEYLVYTQQGWRLVYWDPDSDSAVSVEAHGPKKGWFRLEIIRHWPVLPDKIEIDGNVLYDMLMVVKEYLEAFVWLTDPDMYKVLAAHALLSHAHHAYAHFPVLVIRKFGFGAGGTTLANLMSFIMPRPTANILASSDRAIMTIVDRVKPTIVLDEYGRTDIPEEVRNSIRMVVEYAWARDNYRVLVRPSKRQMVPVTYSLYTPLIIVDTQGVYDTVSTLRRSVVVKITRKPGFHTDMAGAIKIAQDLAPRLYAVGMYLSLHPRFRELAWQAQQYQGFAPYLALWRFAYEIGDHPTVAFMASVVDFLKRFYAEVWEAEEVLDPQARVRTEVETVVELIRCAMALGRLEAEDWCVNWSLARFISALKRRLMETYMVDVTTYEAYDVVSEETEKKRQWKRLPEEYAPYLKQSRVLEGLREIAKRDGKVSVVWDHNRNPRVTVCIDPSEVEKWRTKCEKLVIG